MRKLVMKLCCLSMAVLAGKAVEAQVDPHFTQYYVYPAWLNPSLTGIFDGDYRVSGIYRTQWGNISSPFSTQGLAFDVNTGGNLNAGASVLRQTAGDGGFTYTTAYANFAFTGVRFGPQGYHRLVFGSQIGMIQRRFNPTKLTFGDQWNPVTGYNPGVASADIINKPRSTSFDAGAGILYYDARPGKKTNFFGGASASHLTRPTDQFSPRGDARFPVRYTGHAGLRIAVNTVFSITPNALYLKQGTATEKMIGAYGQYKVSDELEMMFGANYRFKDAVSPFVGFYYKNWVLSSSYDANVSDLGKRARGSNSFEISLTYIGRKSIKTPEVEFICPRL
jgi:type IX secretion system PorP/SprF family membrane protein